MVDKEDMIEGFEELFSNTKMEVMSNSSDVKGNRQLFGQIQGFFSNACAALKKELDNC